MSDDFSREKHSKRLYDDEVHIIKQSKLAKTYGDDKTPPGKYRKKHAMNCGNPACIFCMNPRKSFKELTVQEKSFSQTEGWDD